MLDAILAGDRDATLELSLQALQRANSRVGVFVDLLQPAQYEVGELWYRGEVQVADEHRATAVVQWVTERLPATPVRHPVAGSARCLMVAMGEEEHVLGLRQLQLAFEDDGWKVAVMAPSIAAGDVAERVRATDPSLVCISAGYLPDAKPVKRAIAAVRELRIPVLVGGAAFNRNPTLWRQVGADHHGADARVALVLARRLLR